MKIAAVNGCAKSTRRIVGSVHEACKRSFGSEFIALCFAMLFSAASIGQQIYKCPNAVGHITMQDAPCASGSGATKEGANWISLDEKRRRDQVAAEESRKAEAAAAKLKSERMVLFAHTNNR